VKKFLLRLMGKANVSKFEREPKPIRKLTFKELKALAR